MDGALFIILLLLMKIRTLEQLKKLEYITIDGAPVDEECAQLNGTEDFLKQNKMECNAFAGQLKRVFGKDLEIYMAENRHEFGMYYDLAIIDTDEMDVTLEDIEERLPTHWDEQAIAELAEQDYWPSTNPRPITVNLNK